MKRKRSSSNSFKTKKRIKREFLLFLHAIDSSQTPKQKIMVYDPFKHVIEFRDVEFLNWFYFYSQEIEKILFYFKNHHNGIDHLEKIDNVKLTVGDDTLGPVIKVILSHESVKQSIINNIVRIDRNSRLFETNIPRSVRFITHNKLRFLERFYFKNKTIEKMKGEGYFEIPIWLYTSKNNTKFWRCFQINERYELVYDAQFESLFKRGGGPQQNKIIVCWDSFEQLLNSYSFNDVTIPNCFILYLKSLCLNFLRIKETLRIDKMKIAPRDYYLLNTKKYLSVEQLKQRFDTMCSVFFTYFQQVLFLTKELCIPMRFLFTKPNRKIISDFIFLSNNKSLVCSPPRDQPPYKSNPLQKIFFDNKRFMVAPPGEKLFSLDFSSMYPSIMLKLFKNNPRLMPYIDTIKKFGALKAGEKDKKKRNGYKVILLATYGCFGINDQRAQYLLSSNTKIAKLICDNARNLLEEAIKHFSQYYNVLYCNTDNLVIMGEPTRVYAHLKEWNDKNTDVELKVERVGTKLVIFNKQVRIWFDGEKIEAIGNFFNSVSVCPVVRRFLHKILFESIKASKTKEEFKNNFLLFSKKQIEVAKQYKVSSLFELVETRKYKKNQSRIEEGLDFFLPLFSGLNGDCLDGKFDFATNFVDINHNNFRIDKRLEKYTKKVEDLINKI